MELDTNEAGKLLAKLVFEEKCGVSDLVALVE